MTTKPDYPRLAVAERAAFAELLGGLSDDQMATPSLCEGWTVREVACHVASGHRTGLGGILVGYVASGFSPDRFNSREVAKWRSRSDAELVEAVGEPTLKGLFKLAPAGALTEMVIHEQDVRRPLQIPRAYSEECLLATLEASCTTTTGTGAKKRVKGLRLRAIDVGWTHGDGPEVAGPAEALIMAASGRASALGDLSGDGVAALRSRLAE